MSWYIISQFWVLTFIVCNIINNTFNTKVGIDWNKDTFWGLIVFVLCPPLFLLVVFHAIIKKETIFVHRLVFSLIFPPIIFYFGKLDNRDKMIRDIIE